MHLLIIDPQNDFMDLERSALPVAGATTHMTRLATFIEDHGPDIEGITVTLDWHQTISIERTTFWIGDNGQEVAPFTQITAAEVRAGKFIPRSNEDRVMRYLDALEAQGRYKLVAWPVHCCIGSWGACVFQPLQQALTVWTMVGGQNVHYITKGTNPWTEQYGAFAAEVPDPHDPTTALNLKLINHVLGGPAPAPRGCSVFDFPGGKAGGERVLVAGEASSHCVRRTIEQLLVDTKEADRLTILRDCMGPVAGFEAQADAFLDRMRALGAQVCDSTEIQA